MYYICRSVSVDLYGSRYIINSYNSLHVAGSDEAEPLLQDNLSGFAASLVAAYDSGDVVAALEEGHAGWQKWVKGFSKSLKRKVS